METTASSFAIHAARPETTAVAPAAKHGFSFGDFLDIVNPLQHLPVVGTLYRAVTGDRIDTPEKIAGDALYGGLWGFVSSIADTAFEKATGRNFGDTVLALFTGHRDAQPAPTAVAQTTAAPTAGPDVAALTTSLRTKGIDPETSQRALAAYRRTMVTAFAD